MPSACLAMRTYRSSIWAMRGAAGEAIAMSSSTGAAGGGMAELEVSGLVLRFGGLTVLENVSLSVEPGELFALIGPNGAGKTSVFNCIDRKSTSLHSSAVK